MKHCKSCGKLKLACFFYKNNRNKDGLTSYCKSCMCKKTKEWQHNNPDKVAKHFRTKYQNHTQKVKAQIKLRQAVASGKVLKPHHCEVCKKAFDVNDIGGHHDDYSKPLNVVWCCDKCHKKIHKELDKQKQK